jgi:hypothetical protein
MDFEPIGDHMHRFHLRPSSATAIACIALFVALAGTGAAAVTLARNSIGTAQLKDSAVTNSKIAANAVTTGKVKNHSLLRADFASGQIPAGPRGPAGAPGPAGAAGARGPTGPAGSSAANAWAVVKSDGTIAHQSGVSSVSRTAVGRYTVTFLAGVSNCAWQATLTNLDQNGTLTSGTITTNASATATQVRVATAFQGTAADEPFSITVFC